MAKQRGYPDRRGMGADSDPVAETFVPSPAHHDQQMTMARVLIGMGMPAERVAHSLSLPLEVVRAAVSATPH